MYVDDEVCTCQGFWPTNSCVIQFKYDGEKPLVNYKELAWPFLMRVAHMIQSPRHFALLDETYTCDRSIFSLPFSIRVRSYVYDKGRGCSTLLMDVGHNIVVEVVCQFFMRVG